MARVAMARMKVAPQASQQFRNAFHIFFLAASMPTGFPASDLSCLLHALIRFGYIRGKLESPRDEKSLACAGQYMCGQQAE